MRVNVAQATPPSLSPPSTHNTSSSSFPSKKLRTQRSESVIVGSTLTLNLSRRKSTAHTHTHLRRSISATLDGLDFTDSTPKRNTQNRNCSPKNKPTSFRHLDSRVDLLEPSSLGIRPEPPDWPAREEIIRDCIARRASSNELPLSIRMIKMKQKFQRLEIEREMSEKDVINYDNNPISNLCCSTLFIIKELQSQALKIRGVVLDEDLDGIVSKVQREMTSSFVWLFKEVFAKTPDLMLQVLVLTCNFAVYSFDKYPISETPLKLRKSYDISSNWGSGYLDVGPIEKSREFLEEIEMGLWKSMVEEAKVDQGVVFDDHDHDGVMDNKVDFVSPVRVDIEGDDYDEYHRTDLLYQIGLSHKPNNPLLLSNYAQFLCLVSRDYDRAEECFKRAIQLDPSDAEALSQYANFLWVVRKDLWGAEERFQQAMAAGPHNSYHASKYASFLWSTGGEETCYPLDPRRSKS